MSSLVSAVFFLLCLNSLHACNARRLGFVADHPEIGNQVGYFLAKDVSISKEVFQTKELEEVGVHGRRIQDSWIGAKTMKQTLLNCFHEGKQAVARAISGHGINSIISSGVDNLKSTEKVQGLKRVTRSMLGNSAGGTEEAVDSKEKDSMGDVDVMDYAQPHRKPPIHNEKP